MNTIQLGALVVALGTWPAQADVIHRYSGTIQATVTDEWGDRYQVGQVFHGWYEYFSNSIDGTFASDGNGHLTGDISFIWGFPSDWPDGFEGVFIGDATLQVSNGQATAFDFSMMTDLTDRWCRGTSFGLIDSDLGDRTRASGNLTFSPIHTPDSSSTAFLLAAGWGLAVAISRRASRTALKQ